MENLELKRNQIVFVRNRIGHDAETHAMRGDHYAVIVQCDPANTYSDSIIVAFLSSSVSRLDLKSNILIQFYNGLKHASVIKCSQLATVDRTDIVKIVDTLRPEDITRLNYGLTASLQLAD